MTTALRPMVACSPYAFERPDKAFAKLVMTQLGQQKQDPHVQQPYRQSTTVTNTVNHTHLQVNQHMINHATWPSRSGELQKYRRPHHYATAEAGLFFSCYLKYTQCMSCCTLSKSCLTANALLMSGWMETLMLRFSSPETITWRKLEEKYPQQWFGKMLHSLKPLQN